MDWQLIVWLSVIVICVIAEASTVTLISIWFALGGLAAVVAYLISPDTVWIQTLVFAVCSVGTMLLTRPICKRYLRQKQEIRTNADRNIGEIALCTGRIDNDAGTGSARLLGKEWTARSADGSVIEEGEKVRVQTISGVKLMVIPAASAVSVNVFETP
ncbi:MAG: NfeD family protein [Oscillospiraceae bacterium]|jgi:membrane protein implicated in regulation of membrane protease activity|nr:NfeD family protein [Oscillospiraceae bacterium]